MFASKRLFCLCSLSALLLFTTAAAYARTVTSSAAAVPNTVSVATHLKPGEALPSECIQQGQVFARMVALYPHPKTGWHVTIVCDEASWKSLNSLKDRAVGREAKSSISQYGLTNLVLNTTFIRGWTLTHPDLGTPEAEVVSHLVAHIMLQSDDETKVSAQANEWMRDAHPAVMPSGTSGGPRPLRIGGTGR
jgi:hypothetical protein